MAVVRFEWSPVRRVLVTFGLSLVATGLAVGGVLWWQGHPLAAAVVAGVAAALGLPVAIAPGTAVSRWIYRAVSLPAFAVGNVVSVVFLAVVFYLLLTPMGVLRRWLRDPLGLRRDAGGSRWSDVSGRPEGDPERPF